MIEAQRKIHMERLTALQAEMDKETVQLVDDLVGRIADKWTMTILEVLGEHGELRFSKLSRLIEGISQKVLTYTLRRMERDGLIIRTIHPEIPPRVEYRLTQLGMDLGMAFCAVWIWAAENVARVEDARQQFDNRG